MPASKAQTNLGVLPFSMSLYGHSVNGIPLQVYIAPETTEILFVAGIHGEEPETTALLSKAVRSLKTPPRTTSFILAANPDGLLSGTRGNTRGVDLNRNFNTANWSSSPVYHQWKTGEEQSVPLSCGTHRESEPEVKSLRILIERLQPQYVVALHGPLGWIDDPLGTVLGQWLSKQMRLRLVKEPGYETPGSLGTWALERDVRVITVELPAASVWSLLEHELEALRLLLEGGLSAVSQASTE